MPLVEALSGIRNRRLYLSGQEKPWDEVFGFAWCASERTKAFRPTEYCFGKDENRVNPWGCRQARMDWAEWANWFTYGRWEKVGVLSRKFRWHFDKERIKHELWTNLHRFRFCPHLQEKLAESVLRHLPDTVDPESDPNWGYHQRYEEAPGAIKVVEQRTSGDLTFTNEYWADGVRPKGLRALAELLSKAFRDIGATPITLDDLLK
jgi:hypothetical protein